VNQASDHTDISVDVWENGQIIGILTVSYQAKSWRGEFNDTAEAFCTVIWGTQGQFVVDFIRGPGIRERGYTNRKSQEIIQGTQEQDEGVARAMMTAVSDVPTLLHSVALAAAASHSEYVDVRKPNPELRGRRLLTEILAESAAQTNDVTVKRKIDAQAYWATYRAVSQNCNDLTDSMLDVFFGYNWRWAPFWTGGQLMEALRSHLGIMPYEIYGPAPRSGPVRQSVCFPAGTLIWSTGGTVPIESVAEGECILGWDEETGEAGYFAVTALVRGQALNLCKLRFHGAEALLCTPEHRFWVEGRGWTRGRELVPGDLLYSHRSSGGIPLAEKEEVALQEPIDVYNFEVESAYTYHVGSEGLRVHNFKPRN
jgi:hypothetical protein